MSPAKDQDYFCEGMAEEILSALSGIRGLRVAARSSTFQFKGTTQDVRRIGETLGVNKILEGSVRTAGSRLRVTAQLVNVADGYQIWSARYDREMADVFAIQDEIARAVVEALKMELATPPGPSAQRKHSENLEAYHLYLKGRHQRFKQDFAAALRHYEEAIDLDPRYALARAGIAEVMVLFGMYGFVRPRVAFTRAETELEYAIALGGESSEVLAVDCTIRMTFRRDWDGALEVGRRAVELNPENVYARAWSGLVLSSAGRHDEALAIVRAGADLEPRSPYALGMVGLFLNVGGRFDQATTVLRRCLEIDPNYPLGLWNLGCALVGLRRAGESVPLFERAVGVTRGATPYLAFLAWARAAAGQEEEARALLGELRERSRFGYVQGISLAWIHGALGEIGVALDEVDRGVEEHDHWLNFPLLPGNDPYRSEPRFHAALKRIGIGDGS